MTTPHDPRDGVDGRAIDRLVDGGLSEVDRRSLLLQLEADPEGWRLCALAFLEDQALRNSLVIARSEPTSSPHVIGMGPMRSRMTRFRRSSIAATLLASTFAAGFASASLSKARPEVDRIEAISPQPAPIPPKPDPVEVKEVGTFELVDASAGEASSRRFPIRSGPGLDDGWLRSQPPSVPDYLRARWERQGYQVAERRKLVSVDLEDGRRVSIPVDEVEVDFVGQKPL